MKATEVLCPKCSSANIVDDVEVIGIKYRQSVPIWRCEDCGYSWTKREVVQK